MVFFICIFTPTHGIKLMLFDDPTPEDIGAYNSEKFGVGRCVFSRTIGVTWCGGLSLCAWRRIYGV